MKENQLKRTLEVIKSAKIKTLIPRIRSSKFKNKKYSVIIVKGFPGVWHHQDIMDWFNENKIEGHVLDFGLQIRTITYYTKKLESIINKKFSDKKIVFLGFSMGGIIAIKYAQDNNWKNIEKIITFASPFKGSPVAKHYHLLPGAVDLSPNSLILKKIYKKVPPNKVICVSAKKDELVDNSGTYLPGSKHIILNVYSHGTAQVIRNIKEVLDKELLKYQI